MSPSNKKAGKSIKAPPVAKPSVPTFKKVGSEKADDAGKKSTPAAKAIEESGTGFHYTTKLISPTKTKNSPGDLQLRLRNLYEQLSKFNRVGFNSETLEVVAKDLIQPQFTSSKDDGVKVLAGCCLTEILRLSVPKEPYSTSELGTVFYLFLDLFKKLNKEEGAFSQFYTSVLHSIATLKTILIMDTGDEQLVQDYFLTGFKLVESNISRDKTLRLVDILEQLADVTDTFTTPVIEVILKQFTKKRQVEFPHAFAMARSLCNSAPERLQGPICQYLMDVLSCTKDDDEEEGGRPNIDLEQAHEMLQMVYTIEPRILLSVIPQLEAQLTVVRSDLRRLSLVTLGTFLTLPSATSLLSKYPTIWKSWLQRRTDQDAQIRILLVQQCGAFFRDGTPTNLLTDVCEAIGGLVVDQDEKVRSAACQMVAQLPYASVKKFVPTTLLKKVASRFKDKKSVVRRNLPQMMASLYAQATEDIDQEDFQALDKFKWIPEELLEIVYSNDHHIILETERAFRNTILGPVDDLGARTENLLRVVGCLQQRSYVGLRALQTWQTSLAKDFHIFLAVCRKLGGEKSDLSDTQEQLYARLNLLVKRMLQRFPEPQKMYESLLRYPKSSDRKLNDLFDNLLNATSPKAAQLIEKEAMKRIDQLMPALNEVFSMVLLRLGQTLICREMVPILMRIACQANHFSPFALQILKDLPAIDPSLFEGHVQELGNLVLGSDGSDWLPTLAHYAKAAPITTFPNDKVAKRLARFVLEGTASQAGDAATALSQFDTDSKHSIKTVQSIVTSLSLKSSHLPGHLAALGELVAKHPELTEKHMHTVLEFVLKTLLPSTLELLDAKINAITMLTSRSIAYAGDALKQRLVQPVFSLLWSIIKNKGEVSSKSSPELLAQMRLSAATAILDLATCPAYEAMIAPLQFNLLATTIQDTRFAVREKFGEAVMSRLGQRKLPIKFLVILFLAAFDPEAHFKERIKSFSKQQLLSHASSGDSARVICSTLTRLLHLLAHDSEFVLETKDLQETSKFIDFFLAAAATPDNISLIYSAAGYIKRTEDVLDPPPGQEPVCHQ
ncbi:Sister chromatid cohesion protein pds5 [Entomophthora muscae]|uniref:Sister chromatid cohesion protein pds5 n=1 Tax=Entomophthora muscae TaxID=34485 RepID=A0ACC2USJ8_9FUNG|nr:Sister chromatid cohesion protein pds5 [Entomophthora muscae]